MPEAVRAETNPWLGARMVPAGGIAEPADLAGVIVFLASDRAGYINGQDILVDGGLSQILMGLVPKPTAPMHPPTTKQLRTPP